MSQHSPVSLTARPWSPPADGESSPTISLSQNDMEQRVGAVVHDFNNSLQAIASALMVLQNRLGTGRTDEIARLMEAALSSADRASTNARRLTTYLRSPRVVFEIVNVNELLSGNEPILRSLVGDDIDFELRLAPDNLAIYCDPDELQSAVLNLVVNSKHAMPDGGYILVETVKLGPDRIGLQVADNGLGMSPACIENACNAFYTTKGPQNGSGLGLWSVKDFTERMRGNLAIHSVEGAGTSVQISLPRVHGR
jgi:signal transduction histidine kinase